MKRFNKFMAAAVIIAAIILCFTYCNRDTEKVPEGFAFGIDVSQYNGNIDWPKVKSQSKTKDPIKFVIVRSTVGTDIDKKYEKNYKEAKENGFIVGSYHYYRPNENSAKQFENFKSTVHLERGDVIPIIDIEVNSTVQSMPSLKVGLRNFVNLCEQEYGVKPIIYTKLSMWRDYLQNDFSDCMVWIAAYSTDRRDDAIVQNANLHQFTDRIKDIPGIPSKYVDGDDCKEINTILFK